MQDNRPEPEQQNDPRPDVSPAPAPGDVDDLIYPVSRGPLPSDR